MRSSNYEQTNELYYYEPRASFNLQLIKNLQLKGAWGQYYQFVNRIANEDVTQRACDFWLLGDKDINPSSAEHRILGLNYENAYYAFLIKTYQKYLKDLIEFSRRLVIAGNIPQIENLCPLITFLLEPERQKELNYYCRKNGGID